MPDDALVDLRAEQAVLGALLQRPDLTPVVFAIARPDEFYGRHVDLAVLLLNMYESGVPIDPQTVCQEASRRGLASKIDPVFLVDLSQQAWVPDNAPHYAEQVAAMAARRELQALGVRAVQAAQNPAVDVAAAALDALAGAEQVSERAAGRRETPLAPTVEDLLAVSAEYDWLWPGLLERGDRMILTGGEGLGKSTLLRQFAISAAAGRHPFLGDECDPVTVLQVDLENGWTHLRRKYRPLVDMVARHAREWKPDRLRVEVRPGGMDVTDPQDAAWLVERVTTHRPDLLVIGPLYRMHAADINKEEPARQVVGMIDRCRSLVRCAVIVEAHSGHASGVTGTRALRPIGSSLFMRWPEFGYGIAPRDRGDRSRVWFRSWRGDRDSRSWPTGLMVGSPGRQMPWVVDYSSDLPGEGWRDE